MDRAGGADADVAGLCDAHPVGEQRVEIEAKLVAASRPFRTDSFATGVTERKREVSRAVVLVSLVDINRAGDAQALFRGRRANPYVRVGHRAVDTVDTTENQRVTLRNRGVGADSGRIGDACHSIRVRANETV